MPAVTKETVRSAVLKLRASGEDPTNRRVLQILGRGSFEQIAPLRKEVLEELGPSDPAHLVPPELRERFGWLIADMWETSRAVAEQMLASCKAEAEAAERTASEKVEALTRKVNELAQENRDLQAALIDRSQQLDIAKGRERDALIGEADARRSAAANEMARRAAAAYVKELEDRLQHSNRRLDELIARVPTKEMGDNFGDALAPFQPIEP